MLDVVRDRPCPEPIDVSDDDEMALDNLTKSHGAYVFAPGPQEVKDALQDIIDILKPPRNDKRQVYKDPGLDKKTVKRLEDMKIFCRMYIDLAEKASESDNNCTRGIW